MGGWLEKVKIKLNSTQIVVEVEVRVELGNMSRGHYMPLAARLQCLLATGCLIITKTYHF